jgi:hypothetical protein
LSKLEWVLGRSLGSLVGKGGERSSKVVGGANGGRRRVAELLGRARKRSRGVYRPVVAEAVAR